MSAQKIYQPLIAMVIIFLSCNGVAKNNLFKNPRGYNFSRPIQIKLPLELDEISGIVFYEKDTSIFAISDDRGALFKIKPNANISKWKFSHGADYEDVALVDSTFYILQSNGDIYKVNYQQDKAAVQSYSFPKGNSNEFETLYYNPTNRKLILICKDCDSDKKKKLTTYSFDPTTGQFSDSSYSIAVTDIAQQMGEKKIKFKPSAAAINPVNRRLYIISSVNKLLVVTDKEGKVEEVCPINPAIFKQPEGITFNNKGDMIVSNEFAESGTANLLVFKYNSFK